MKTICLNELTAPLRQPAVATIGFFDGVHIGHRHLIRQVAEAARDSAAQSMVITFDRHPREVLGGSQSPFLLSSFEEKLRLLALTGVDIVVILPFSRELAALSARDFMQQVLADRLCVSRLVIGHDNRFGHNRTEGFDDYAAYGRAIGMEVLRAEELRVDDRPVSSSVIRSLLEEGRVEAAARLLGRPYELSGQVIHGFEEGRKIGFPTANLRPCSPLLLVPGNGVYQVEACIDGSDEWLPAMTNIGMRPTFNGHEQTIETHIFRFSRDLYDRALTLRFLRFLRGEQRFNSPEALRRQLEKDKQLLDSLTS